MTRFWLLAWAFMAVCAGAVAVQPIGLGAQAAFGVSALALMGVVRLLRLRGTWHYIFLAAAGAVALRYLYWRLTSTLPSLHEPLDFTLGAVLLLAELYAVTMLLLNVFIVCDPVDRAERSPQGAPESWPTVDVLVPSYNEGADIVGNTLAAARNMDYPADRLRIVLLDDGATEAKLSHPDPARRREAEARRDEMRALAAEMGVDYEARRDNDHAKAGNLNAGLARTAGELILVLDADHAPAPDFLMRTVGHMQADPRLFLVQTPHFFLNGDPLERNLGLHKRMPSENEMFYAVTQRGLDKWDAAYFCGSAALLRREALNEIGGFRGRTITEDCESALELHAKGWHSAYVDRAMIGGLQPESYAALIAQRSRWAQGMTQILMLSNPLLKRTLSWPQRLGYLSAGLFWLFPFARLVFMLAPVAYIFFDRRIYVASLDEFVAYTLVFIAASLMLREQVFGSVRWPWLSEIYEYAQSPHLAWAVVKTWMNPKAPSFAVTAKGETLDARRLSPLAGPLVALFALLAVTTVFGVSRVAGDLHDDELLLVVTGWSVFNLLIAAVSLGVVSEKRERRSLPRLDVDVAGTLCVGGIEHPVRLVDASVGGVRIETAGGPIDVSAGDAGLLAFEGVAYGRTVSGAGLTVRLASAQAMRRGGATGYGLELVAPDASARRAMASLLYPSSDRFESIRRGRQKARSFTAGTLEFPVWGVVQIGRGFFYAGLTLTALAARVVRKSTTVGASLSTGMATKAVRQPGADGPPPGFSRPAAPSEGAVS